MLPSCFPGRGEGIIPAYLRHFRTGVPYDFCRARKFETAIEEVFYKHLFYS